MSPLHIAAFYRHVDIVSYLTQWAMRRHGVHGSGAGVGRAGSASANSNKGALSATASVERANIVDHRESKYTVYEILQARNALWAGAYSAATAASAAAGS